MGSSRRIEKCPQSGWGCMGGGATDHHLEGKDYPVQLYIIFYYIIPYIIYHTVTVLHTSYGTVHCTAGPGIDDPRGDGP